MPSIGLGSVKRFRVRYGLTNRFKRAKVESQYYGRRLKCPFCLKSAVKRVFVGVWECRQCAVKFTAKAYGIEAQQSVEDVLVEKPAEKVVVEEA